MMNNWSMYRVVTIWLAVIIAAGAVLSALGLVGFSPAGILVTAVVAIGGTLLGSAIGRMIVRTRLHIESSIITGLLIASIVPPTLEAIDIIGAASAGMIAGVSKFLIAPGGRHIVNPAAVGVSVAVVFGLSFSFWWVATPVLTPLIIIGGVLVAYRAGVLRTVGAYAAIAFALLGTRLLVSGEQWDVTLWLMVTSYPVLFLGLFMLTEPLTLPIRQWQQYVVAGVVGAGVALPFSVELGNTTVYSSPELALVAGNIVAWGLVASRKHRRATSFTVTDMTPKSDSVTELQLALRRPLALLPGQWVEVHLSHPRADGRGQRRIFSVSSDNQGAAGESPSLTIATRRAQPGSTFKKALLDSPLPLTGRITQVGGEFVPPAGSRPLVCVAGGIGITPFVSWIRSAQTTADGALDVWLVVVTKESGELLYPELDSVPGVKIIEARTLDDIPPLLADLPTPLPNCFVAVSGAPGFVRSASQVLRRAGAKKITTDRFTGY